MGRRVAILQSSYIPWKGYFDIIASVDEFVLYDEVQFSPGDWRNRNRIKTPAGCRWLTVPIRRAFPQRISDVRVDGRAWRVQHWRSLYHSYHRTPHFGWLAERFERLYLESEEESLSLINRQFLEEVCAVLGVRTRLSWSSEYPDQGAGRSQRLVDICRTLGAAQYLSGPSARDYLDQGLFREAGIAVRFMDYEGYPEYPQPYPPFEHAVSILDLLFCTGPDAPQFLRRAQPPAAP